MGAFLSHVPGRMVGAMVAALLMTAALTALLFWHWLRRAMDVPRVPKPRAMYGALALGWAGLATLTAAVLVTAFLLRDHQRVAGATPLAVLRCEPIGPGRLRMEILPLNASATRTPEHYELEGAACPASVVEVELRPGLRALGVPALARIDAVGPFARSRTNPGWLTPGAPRRPDVTALVVRQSRVVQVLVPPEPGRQFVLTAAPGQEPALSPASASEPNAPNAPNAPNVVGLRDARTM